MNSATRRAVMMGSLMTGLWGIAAAAPNEVTFERQNTNAQFVETTYRSLCNQAPDPATFNYYWNLLNDGVKSASDVHAAIAVTCQRAAGFNPCAHIVGASDLCPTSEN